METWLDSPAQRVVTSTKVQLDVSDRGKSQGLRLGLILSSIFIRDLDNRTEHSLSIFAANTTLGGVLHSVRGISNRLQKQASRKLLKFNTKRQSPSHVEASPPITGTSTGWVPTSWKLTL